MTYIHRLLFGPERQGDDKAYCRRAKVPPLLTAPSQDLSDLRRIGIAVSVAD